MPALVSCFTCSEQVALAISDLPDVSLLHHTSSAVAAGAPRQVWSPWKHQEMGQGQRAPQLSSVHLPTHPSHTCTASLLNSRSSKIQFLRLAS